MKTLQNNFTTPEQSKRLLELGLPTDSADCYMFKYGNEYNGIPRPFFLFPKTYEYVEDLNARYGDKILPCWSVGRLMEILVKCEFVDVIYIRKRNYNKNTIDRLIEVIERCVKADFDFSKLEE